jgi:hypothetical protein
MPTKVVQLPGGHSATFSTDGLTQRDMLKLERGMYRMYRMSSLQLDQPQNAELLPEDVVDALLFLRTASILTFLRSWTLPEPLPESEDDLLNLPVEVFAPLADAAGGMYTELMNTLPNFSPDAPATPGQPVNPTAPRSTSRRS